MCCRSAEALRGNSVRAASASPCCARVRCHRNFRRAPGFEPGFDSAVLNVSAADVAQAGYRGLMANKRAVLPGLGIKIVPFMLRLFPRGFILAAVGRFQLRKR